MIQYRKDKNFIYVNPDAITVQILRERVPEEWAQRYLSRHPEGYHMTLVPPAEMQALRKRWDVQKEETAQRVMSAFADMKTKPILRGVGSAGDLTGLGRGAYFVVVNWAEAEQRRAQLALERFDFHVTLGVAESGDVYGVRKDTTTLL